MYQWPRRPQKLAAARSKTKTKPLGGKRAQHRSPATPDVHEPDFVPDPATRPRKRSIWHEIDADPVSDAAPKDIHHGSPQTLCLRLCYGKQMRVCRLRLRRSALPRSRQSFSTRLASSWPADIAYTDCTHRTPNSISQSCCSRSQVREGLSTSVIPSERSPTDDLPLALHPGPLCHSP